ncbi:MAG: hypothetical protein ABI890_06700 [Lapillicoccus sp.]
MPIWVVFLAVSLLTTWVAVSLLSKVNEGVRIPVVGSPPVVPGTFLVLFGAGVACAWLAGSYASESLLGPYGYLVGALGLAVPWTVVVVRHNRSLS